MGRTGTRTARRAAAALTALTLLGGLGPTVATASATPTSPTQEAAPSPTAEPTPEVVPTPTSEPTQEAAPSPTAEPTQEAVPAPAGAVEEPAAAQAAVDSPVVVGLGDSYASGEGTFDYDYGTAFPPPFPVVNECHRSRLSWQRILEIPGSTGQPQFVHKACSGAVVNNILSAGQYNEPAQITALQGRTDEDIVLLSIGGNDVGFSGLVTRCATEACLKTQADRDAVEGQITNAVRSIGTALDRIVADAPQATVVLAGYPQLIQGTGCRDVFDGLLWDFDAAEAAELDRLAVLLRRLTVGEVMQRRTVGKNIRFADTIDPFKGHGACGALSSQWINSITTGEGPPEAFHPNAEGYRAYATAVTNVLRSDPMRCDGVGCRIKFQDESVYGSVGSGTQAVTGRIRIGYEAAGEERGVLGYPKSGEYDEGPNGRGQQFTGGDFFYEYGTEKAYWVGGKFLVKYKAIGDANGSGELGYPTSNAYTNTGSTGQSQQFERGLMLLKNGGSQAFWSKGAILAKYASTNYERGYLGYPKTDHACGLQPGNACRQHFDGSGDSVVYWTSATGAHSITGYLRDFYASTGWQNSRPDPTTILLAGYPTSDRYRLPGGTADLQDFEGGIMAGYGGRACWGIPDSDACFPPTPVPKTVSNTNVGTILGAYAKAPQRDYGGYAYPAVENGQCVIVERKTASGSWTTSSVTTGSPDRCNLFAWGIANDTAVSDTVAIRLRVSSGPNAPNSYVNLCSSKSECLAM